jgi:hypothetical protein
MKKLLIAAVAATALAASLPASAKDIEPQGGYDIGPLGQCFNPPDCGGKRSYAAHARWFGSASRPQAGTSSIGGIASAVEAILDGHRRPDINLPSVEVNWPWHPAGAVFPADAGRLSPGGSGREQMSPHRRASL